jgi:hypothetical protein
MRRIRPGSGEPSRYPVTPRFLIGEQGRLRWLVIRRIKQAVALPPYRVSFGDQERDGPKRARCGAARLVALRKELDLYACLRPCKSYPGVRSRYSDIDLIVVRENTEDLYAGVEYDTGTEEAAQIIKMSNGGINFSSHALLYTKDTLIWYIIIASSYIHVTSK